MCCRAELLAYGLVGRSYGVFWDSVVVIYRAEELCGAVGLHCGSIGQSEQDMGCCGTALCVYEAEWRYRVLWSSAVHLCGRVKAAMGCSDSIGQRVYELLWVTVWVTHL